MSRKSFIATYRLAPNEPSLTVEKIGFNETWAFADNNARYNKAFSLLSIVEKDTGTVMYHGGYYK